MFLLSLCCSYCLYCLNFCHFITIMSSAIWFQGDWTGSGAAAWAVYLRRWRLFRTSRSEPLAVLSKPTDKMCSIKCVLGPDSSCDWSITVRDWVNHAKHSSTHKNEHSVEFSSPDVAITLIYEAFSNWTAFGVFYYINNNYFLVFAIKREDMLHVTVRHVPVCKPDEKFYLETILENSRNVLYIVLQMASLFLGNERFESDSTCFSLDHLSDTIVKDTLVVSCRFIKH